MRPAPESNTGLSDVHGDYGMLVALMRQSWRYRHRVPECRTEIRLTIRCLRLNRAHGVGNPRL
jgi:hypothetical protein